MSRADDRKAQAAVSRTFPSSDGWKPLFNGKDLSGWKFRNPRAKKVWKVCDDVRLDPADPSRLAPVGSGGAAASALLCGDDGRGSDIMTEESFGDYQLHIEFTVPKGATRAFTTAGFSRSRSSTAYGKPKLGFHDCGALYERAFPRENLSKPPGQWQTYDITLDRQEADAALERQDGLQGPRRPLRRDRPRRLHPAQPGKRRQA